MSQSCGLMPDSLQFSMRVAITAQLSPPSSDPAKSAFLRFRAIGRIDRSTVFEVDAAIVKKVGEPVPAAKSVADCLGQFALGTNLAEPCF